MAKGHGAKIEHWIHCTEINKLLCYTSTNLSVCINPTPPHKQDVTQGQF